MSLINGVYTLVNKKAQENERAMVKSKLLNYTLNKLKQTWAEFLIEGLSKNKGYIQSN